MSDGARATITRTNGQTVYVTDVETERTVAITVHGGPVKLECHFPKGMLVRRAEVVDATPPAGVQSQSRPAEA